MTPREQRLFVRFLPLLLVATGIGFMGLVLFYFLYIRPSTFPHGTRTVTKLSRSIQLYVDPNRSYIEIHADTLSEDIWTALGYAHALLQPAELLTLRQIARGEVHRWYPQGIKLDESTWSLALPFRSKDAYTRLPSFARRFLKAYVRGLNQGFREAYVRHHPQVVLLPPEALYPWTPEDPIAIELLLALVGTEIPPTAPPSLHRHIETLRQTLQLGGFEYHQITFLPQEKHWYLRYVYGQRLVSLLVGAAIRLPSASLILATVPGTLLLPAGFTPHLEWAFTLFHPTHADTLASTTTLPRPMDTHITTPSGSRYISARWASDALFFPASSPHWRLHSTGFRTYSLIPFYLTLLHHEAETPLLSDMPDGLIRRRNHVQETGISPHISSSSYHTIGYTPWPPYVTKRLLQSPHGWEDTFSLWAAQELPDLLSQVDSTHSSPQMRQALTFLRNWDFRYRANEVAPSIFDTWILIHSRFTSPTSALEKALQQLQQSFGPDLARWQWHRVQRACYGTGMFSDVRFFPHQATTHFAPICEGHSGHPSTPSWTTSPLLPTPAPAAWEAWITPDSLYLRYPYRNLSHLLARLQPEPLRKALRLSRLYPLRTTVKLTLLPP